MVKVKTFIQALNTFLIDTKKAKTYLNDQRLSRVEKQIIECYFLLRDNKTTEVVQILTTLKSPDDIVESQRKLLLGIAYNNQSNYQAGIQEIEASLGLLHASGLTYQEFVAYHNLFILYTNLKNTEKMAQMLDEMNAIPKVLELQKISLQKAAFCYLVMIENYSKAREHMKWLDLKLNEMAEPQAVGYLIDKFDYYMKLGELEKAEQVIAQMKKYRKFQLSSIYNFMKHLLAHLKDDAPLWISDSDYQDLPLVFHQIKCIQKLEQANRDEAIMHWNQLRQIDPQTYKDDLKYNGDVCLFSLCLDKYTKNKVCNDHLSEIKGESKEEVFYKILMEAKAPISKEMIYKLIYKEDYVDKSDLMKLQKLVSRARTKYNIHVEFLQNCYRLKDKKAA